MVREVIHIKFVVKIEKREIRVFQEKLLFTIEQEIRVKAIRRKGIGNPIRKYINSFRERDV